MLEYYGRAWLFYLTLFATLVQNSEATSQDWVKTARTFLIDAYQYPFAPEMEFDAEAIASVMQEMHVNTVRMATMGKYAT